MWTWIWILHWFHRQSVVFINAVFIHSFSKYDLHCLLRPIYINRLICYLMHYKMCICNLTWMHVSVWNHQQSECLSVDVECFIEIGGKLVCPGSFHYKWSTGQNIGDVCVCVACIWIILSQLFRHAWLNSLNFMKSFWKFRQHKMSSAVWALSIFAKDPFAIPNDIYI